LLATAHATTDGGNVGMTAAGIMTSRVMVSNRGSAMPFT
jgi:hypothetical protein